jgi:glycosyltransferase involved in cell wall biosynthesis
MTGEQPLVSVLMTVFNRQAFIKEAIESVLSSTCTSFELIIVDDGSTDDSVLIARKYAAQDNRVKVYINERNLGDYPNRNRAASLATGDYILFVDSDDTIHSDGIEKCITAMEAYPHCSYGICVLQKTGQPVHVMNSKEAVYNHFFVEPFLMVGPGGTIQKRIFFDQINRYPEKYGPANDMYYHLKAACYTDIVILPFEFMYYRRHEGQEINNKFAYMYHNYNYLSDAVEELPLPLTDAEKKWIQKKNKRRFLHNLILFFGSTFNLRKTMQAAKAAHFNFKNALEAIFQ